MSTTIDQQGLSKATRYNNQLCWRCVFIESSGWQDAASSNKGLCEYQTDEIFRNAYFAYFLFACL